MERTTIQFIAESCGAKVGNIAPGASVSGVSTDSRQVTPGELFVALSGEKFDGHQFVPEVLSKGAVAAVIEQSGQEKFHFSDDLPLLVVKNTRSALGAFASAYRRQFDLPTVAVAGSNGKTTTKELVAAVLAQKLSVTASPASFNNDIGVPMSLLQIEKRHQAGVFEAGTNHPGELRPLLEMIAPSIGIITSIGREHLEFFHDLNGVLEEEGQLAEVLGSNGLLVLNGESHGVGQLKKRTRARCLTIGGAEHCDWRIEEVQMEAEGARFRLKAPSQGKEFSGEYRTHLLGMHQVVNATFSIVVGKELGLGRAEIQRGLDSCRGAKMRLQLTKIDEFLVLNDAYNANADSMIAALQTLRDFPCRGRRIAVLGDMAELGSDSEPAHREVGQRAGAAGIDVLFAVGKSSGTLASSARSAGLDHVVEELEVEKAGQALAEVVARGDVVLVKASRSTRLERVVEILQKKFGEKNGANGPAVN